MYISNFQILERSWSRGCHIAVDMYDQQSFLWLGSFEWKLCSLFHTIMAMQLKRQLNHKLLTEDSWLVTSHSCCSSWSWWRRESLGWGDPGRGSQRGRRGCCSLLSSARREDPSWRSRQHPPVESSKWNEMQKQVYLSWPGGWGSPLRRSSGRTWWPAQTTLSGWKLLQSNKRRGEMFKGEQWDWHKPGVLVSPVEEGDQEDQQKRGDL